MIKNFFVDLYYRIKRLIPKYHGVPIYRPYFWKLIYNRITKGYDDSVTWSLYYNIAKWIYPRLVLFYDKIEESGAVPQDYEDIMIKKYLDNGFKWDKHYYRFEDKKVEKEMHHDALQLWKEDVWKMCEAFRDILAEDDDWEKWNKNWKFYVNSAKIVYNTLKNDKDRKNYWDNFCFDRNWKPGIIFTVYDFAEKYRQEGLELFTKHFQSLWW